MAETAAPYEGWTILELLGHRRLGGFVREAEVAGSKFLRIDVPAPPESPDEIAVTQYYGAAAVYCLTPVTEEVARAVAGGSRPSPVHRWELPPARIPARDDEEIDLDDSESHPY